MNMTQYGMPGNKLVLIIDTIVGRSREWNIIGKILCKKQTHTVMIVHLADCFDTLWKCFLMLDEAKRISNYNGTYIVLGKRTGAQIGVKYYLQNSTMVDRLGLYAPNVTHVGDIWSLYQFRFRVCLFWSLDDKVVSYQENAGRWESTIQVPVVTTSTGGNVVSQNLIPSIIRFIEFKDIIFF